MDELSLLAIIVGMLIFSTSTLIFYFEGYKKDAHLAGLSYTLLYFGLILLVLGSFAILFAPVDNAKIPDSETQNEITYTFTSTNNSTVQDDSHNTSVNIILNSKTVLQIPDSSQPILESIKKLTESMSKTGYAVFALGFAAITFGFNGASNPERSRKLAEILATVKEEDLTKLGYKNRLDDNDERKLGWFALISGLFILIIGYCFLNNSFINYVCGFGVIIFIIGAARLLKKNEPVPDVSPIISPETQERSSDIVETNATDPIRNPEFTFTTSESLGQNARIAKEQLEYGKK